MKKSVRRILSSVLCFALLIATVPTFVFAAGTASITIDGSSYSAGVDGASVTSVTLPIKVEATNVNVADWKLTYDSNVFESASVSLATGIAGSVELKSAAIWWEADDVQNISGNFIDLTLTLKAGAELGDTTVSVAGTMTDDDYEDIDVATSVTLSIIDGSASTSEYTANISTTATEFEVNDTVAVTVNVGGTTASFASSEVTLTYDSTYLTFNQDASTLNGAGVDLTVANTIKLVDHGDTNAYPDAYVLNFTANKATTGAVDLVTLTDAKFSTAANAISSDLIEATGENKLSLTIKNADLEVTLPESGVVIGNATVPYGGDYTFTAENNTTYMYYDYSIKVTMGTTDVTESVVYNNNGSWTVNGVTDDLVIEVTETPKTYTVTVDGDSTVTTEEIAKVTTTGVTDGKAAYNTAVTYTLPAGQAATDTVDGWHYIATVTVDGTSFTASASDLTYTIAGDKVTGNIVITLSKMVDPADSVKVTISGSNEIQKDGQTVTEFTATKNSEVTLTLVPEVGYTYVINDGTKDLTINDDNTFTVTVGESLVIITVTKTLDTTSVKVQQYLTLNETNMWLVIINGNTDADNGGTKGEISGKTYTYDGMHMFWSTKYDAYCSLVVAETLTVNDAKEKIGSALVEANAVDVEYNMDVNNTSGKVDANDAQLVYNMYQTMAYDGFDTVDMIKFLEADLNNSVGVDSTDATVIVNFLLNKTN